VSESARLIYMSEVFSAIQGEGSFVGERQVFVRLAGCNIRCAYCDQPEALEKVAGPCRLETTAGRRDWAIADSPIPIDMVADAVDRLAGDVRHHSVSLTGGEPLFQGARLARLAALLAGRGHRLHLETNGMLALALVQVGRYLSHVSMDLKLPSVDGENVDLGRHRRFLATAMRLGNDVACKIVIGPCTDADELAAAVSMVTQTAPRAVVFLQPVTPFAGVTGSPGPERVLELQAMALELHERVRVVPQTHKAIGQL